MSSGWIPDSTNYPKAIPYGSYKITLKMFSKPSELVTIANWYGKFQKIIRW